MLRIPFVLLLNLYGLVRYGLASVAFAIIRSFQRKRRYVKLELQGNLPYGHPGGLGQMFKSEATFLDIRRDIKTLAGDKKIAGVVLKPGKAHLGAARNADLVDALDTLRVGGKHVVAHSTMIQTRDYIEATAADDILMTPAGRVYTFSPRFEQYFLGGAFEKHGVSAQFVRIGAFKSASSRFVRTGMSMAERGMLGELRDGLVQLHTERVAKRRRIPSEAAARLFSDSPMDIRDAQTKSLIDGACFIDDLPRWLQAPDEHRHIVDNKADLDAELVEFRDYIDERPTPFKWRPLARGPRRLAIVDLTGMIVQDGMNLPGASSVIDPKHVLPLLRKLRDNRRIAGVLLHINSPGGSALSSDLLWKAVSDLRQEKPVVAYCSDVAASGGYYIAVGADKIICRPESIMGSIGVVAGKLSIGEAVKPLGVTTESVDGDDGSEFLSLTTPLSERTMQNLASDTRSFYRRFLQRVGQARGIERRRLHRYARGRVYLGEQAAKRGLVDGVGGFEQAVAELRSLCSEDGTPLPEEAELEFHSHEHRTLKDVLRKSAMQMSAEWVWEPLDVLALVRQSPLLALMPYRLR